MALMATGGAFTDGFKIAMDGFTKPGITFIYWDGHKLAEKLVGTGLGMNYSPNTEYWIKLDADLLNKEPLLNYTGESTDPALE